MQWSQISQFPPTTDANNNGCMHIQCATITPNILCACGRHTQWMAHPLQHYPQPTASNVQQTRGVCRTSGCCNQANCCTRLRANIQTCLVEYPSMAPGRQMHISTTCDGSAISMCVMATCNATTIHMIAAPTCVRNTHMRSHQYMRVSTIRKNACTNTETERHVSMQTHYRTHAHPTCAATVRWRFVGHV